MNRRALLTAVAAAAAALAFALGAAAFGPTLADSGDAAPTASSDVPPPAAGGATSGSSGSGSPPNGVDGASAPTLVAASGAIVPAQTVGRTSVELRTGVPGADARRVEYTHVAGTTVVVGGAGAVTLLPRSLAVRPSPLGLALVLFGAICLTVALFVD